jgi:hypothetical protein
MGFMEIVRFFENVVAIAFTLSFLTLMVGLLSWLNITEDLLAFVRRILRTLGMGKPKDPPPPGVNIEWRDQAGALMLLTEFVSVRIFNGRGRTATLVDGVFIGCDVKFRPGTHCKVVVEGGAFIEECVVQLDLQKRVLFVQSAKTAQDVLARITSGGILAAAA